MQLNYTCFNVLKKITVILAGLTFILISSYSLAAQDAPTDLEAVPEPPPLPPKVESGETLEPDVTIIEGEKETIREYRINGKIYAIKVVPKSGPAYYLVDVDGDGNLETRRNDLDADILIPSWVLFSW